MTVKTCIIYHSYSGITRGVAGQIQAACEGDLIEVKPRNDYTRLTVYPAGGMRALRGYCDPIDPETIDVSFCDLIVIGSPVWAWKTTPPVNAALAALTGTAGKKAVIFATCGSQAGETLPLMRRALEEKGVMVIGEAVLTRQDIRDGEKIQDLIRLLKGAGTPA
jgi:flavodoxin